MPILLLSGGGANPAGIWGRGQSCCYLGEGPILLLSGGGAWQWCISQCSHDSAFNGGYPFLVLQVSPPVQAAAYVWCCHGNHRVLPSAEHGEVHVRLPQVWLCVGTILPASRPGGQAWYLPRVPVQWTLQVNMEQVCVVMCVPVSVHRAMCVCLPVHIVYLFYLTLLLPTQYTGLPPPQTIY